ncbi:aldehyde dehydrogenase family protein [Geodermatophilus sp. DSM 44513]|uniref:aldehyde dehydrogenase family protein n=1 Tax=Geodermatophilus sp. DSM 44513 TaxID=1528104 RepID=UPI00126E3FBD|nr:aldehyde dehydrogenase family protein [Geodermatophilus sp. DSM 44513]WNV75826.1 aldehyde dehydrogenase family protein [Geodermatophilus sp. DSM 44513]
MTMLSEGAAIDDVSPLEITNPANGAVLGEMPVATPEQRQAAVDGAQHGRRAMAAMAPHERAGLLLRIAQAVEERGEELSTLLAAENGKPIRQTREEVKAAVRIFRGFAAEATRVFGRQIPLGAVPGLERHLAVTVRGPVGVVAAVVPFNYPVELYAHKAAAALAGGNAVLVKPPEKCPLALLEIARIVEEAGAPPGAHQVVTGGADAARFLASSPGIQLVSLTGSTDAGRALAALAADTLKKLHLELGGNDAMIVCADADLEKAAEAVVLGRLARGNGQICCAVKRVYVDRRVHDDFADALRARATGLVVADQLDEGTDVGPLITRDAAVTVELAVSQALNRGARRLVGGDRDGAFFHPTVLVDVTPDEESVAEEVFGPVVPLLRVEDPESAVELTNDSPYGLQAAVFTRDVQRAFSLASRLEVGSVVINGSTALRAENLPFGGGKMTGGAREGLHDTLLDMTEQKNIIVMDALS